MKQASEPVPKLILFAYGEGKRAYEGTEPARCPYKSNLLLRWAWTCGYLDADRDWLRKELIIREIESDD